MVGQSKLLSFRELAADYHFNTAYNGYCTVDGVACTQIGSDREVFIDSKGKLLDFVYHRENDGRKAANEKRTGGKLARSGKYVRTSEVKRTVMAWVAAIGGIKKVRFTTISFPEGTPDHIAKKCLNIFFTRWRKAVPDLSYLWTAERQKNNTIHFHIVQDKYMNIQILNSYMRTSLGKRLDQIPNYSKEQLAIYNGVDVGAKQYTDLGIVKYLAKYLTKATQSGINQPWHRSRMMGELATKVRFSMDRIRGIMNIAFAESKHKDRKFKVFQNDYCLYISWPPNISRLIEYHLDQLNIARWKGLKKRSKYPFHARNVPDLKVHPCENAKMDIGLQLTIQNMFQTVNYQTQHGIRPFAKS